MRLLEPQHHTYPAVDRCLTLSGRCVQIIQFSSKLSEFVARAYCQPAVVITQTHILCIEATFDVNLKRDIGMAGDDDPDGSLARRYLQTVVDVVPHLLEGCCHAPQTETRNALQRSFFTAQMSLISCQLSLCSLQEAPQAVLVAATRLMCEHVHLTLAQTFERGDGNGLRDLRRRAYEQRTEIDPKRSSIWIHFGEAVRSIVPYLVAHDVHWLLQCCFGTMHLQICRDITSRLTSLNRVLPAVRRLHEPCSHTES